MFLDFFFLYFLNLNSILKIFKNKWPLKLMYFRTYRLRKMWLDTRVKSTVSEDPSTSKMVKEAKYISKLNNI